MSEAFFIIFILIPHYRGKMYERHHSGAQHQPPPCDAGRPQVHFEWPCKSDLTRCILGLPDFPHNPVPEWKEFVKAIKTTFSMIPNPCWAAVSSLRRKAGSRADQLQRNRPGGQSVELDIWLSGREHTAKGYGSAALQALCGYRNRNLAVDNSSLPPPAAMPGL